MLQSIWQDAQRQFQFGNRINQLILINVAAFIIINLTRLIARGFPGSTFYDSALHFFAFSDSWWHNLTHPWTLLTYAFVHEGLWHLFWNMILLYWFGRIVGDLYGDRRILPLYLLGAVGGALLYWLVSVLLGSTGVVPHYLIGASAGVMAIVLAAALIAPDYMMRLILIGPVRLKYVALGIILIDLFAIGTDGNFGGHIAHIGGLVMGYIFVRQAQSNRDLADPINRGLDRVGSVWKKAEGTRRSRVAPRTRGMREAKGRFSERFTAARPKSSDTPSGDDQAAKLDAILDKINANGIKSLTQEERDFLSLQSRKKS